MKRILIAFFITQFTLGNLFSQHTISINDYWHFQIAPEGNPERVDFSDDDWETVNLPHTWNAEDPFDEEPGFYRGTGWYRKNLSLTPDMKGQQLTLYFEGAFQDTDVYINGAHIGNHKGGYTSFAFDITDHINFDGENLVVIKVDNSHNEDIPSLSGDWTFFGGIYRDVYLIATNPLHFSRTDNGSLTGIYTTTPEVTANRASVSTKAVVKHDGNAKARITIVNEVVNADGEVVASGSGKYTLNSGEEQSYMLDQLVVSNPELWSPENPYLYKQKTYIKDKKGNVLDEVTNPLGFRWYSFDADGFKLNGKPYKLIGTNRHQDYPGLGNALPDELHVRDVEKIKAMGANFLRISHYPQDPAVLHACDRLGIITTEEIPIVNTITVSDDFFANCRTHMREMIHRDYNHPSLLVWGYMNEVLLGYRQLKSKPDQLKAITDEVAKLAQQLNDIAKELDPDRYTLLPNHGDLGLYKDAGLTAIPDIVGWNLYYGWYIPEFDGLNDFIKDFEKEVPGKPMIITEYGAGSDPRIHAFDPVRFDFSIEWSTIYHEKYYDIIMDHPVVVGANVWNYADFSSAGRKDAVPGINNKGILSYDRQPKPAYYFYQAKLLEHPVINIASKSWRTRAGVASGSENEVVQPVDVYTNMPEAELFLNGYSLGKKTTNTDKITWQVPFVDGVNKLKAVGVNAGRTYEDYQTINFTVYPSDLSDGEWDFIQVNNGSHYYFNDAVSDMVWLPDQPYQQGSYGYIGKDAYVYKTSKRSGTIGSDKWIENSDNEPLYQLQLINPEGYKIDVPDGTYEVTCYFTELLSKGKEVTMINNLDDPVVSKYEERVFDVSINGNMLFDNLDLMEDYGGAVAVYRSMVVEVTDGKGIVISFDAEIGLPVLNGVQVRKIMEN